MKAIVIAGRLTKDATLRTTQQGDKIASFSVAVDDGYGQNKGTLFFDCSMWGKRGESLSGMLTKGKPVTVSGDLGTREYEGKTYLTVRVNDVDLQGGAPQRDNGGSSGGYEQPRNGAPAGGRSEYEDEIPFAAEWRA